MIRFRDFIVLSVFLAVTACGKKSTYFEKNPLNLEHASDTEYEKYLEEYRHQYNFWLGEQSGSMNLPHFTSSIDEDFLKKLQNDVENEIKDIALSSTGGIAGISAEIGDMIYENDVGIRIFGFCLSACAEDLITSSKGLVFFDRPLIGYHGNAISYLNEINENNAQDPCPNPDSNSKLKQDMGLVVEKKTKLYAKTGKQIGFWTETKKRLGSSKFDHFMLPNNQCVPFEVFENAELWFPTSTQLSNLLGLTFDGELCADYEACYTSKLLVYFGPGRRFIVGDELIVTAIPLKAD